jgi:hypothetical protein
MKRDLEKRERDSRLTNNADFRAWRQELEILARMEGLNTLSPNRSNYDRAMASGILDFIERRFLAMERSARPEVVKKLRKSLEESEDGQRGSERAGQREPSGFAGISAIGEF